MVGGTTGSPVGIGAGVGTGVGGTGTITDGGIVGVLSLSDFLGYLEPFLDFFFPDLPLPPFPFDFGPLELFGALEPPFPLPPFPGPLELLTPFGALEEPLPFPLPFLGALEPPFPLPPLPLPYEQGEFGW